MSKKKIIICYLLLFVIVIISSVLLYKNENSMYVFVNNKEMWRKNNNNWKKVSNNYIKKYQGEEFNFFLKSKFNGKIYYKYDGGSINLYDENNTLINFGPSMISIKSKLNYDNVKTASELDNVEKDSNVVNILDRFSLNKDQMVRIKKYELDLDNDGKNDYLYSISNFYLGDEKADKRFSIIFSVINGDVNVVDKTIVDLDKQNSTWSTSLNSVIDLDLDNNFELILVSTSYGQDDIYCMKKYNSDSNKFETLIDCEE